MSQSNRSLLSGRTKPLLKQTFWVFALLGVTFFCGPAFAEDPSPLECASQNGRPPCPKSVAMPFAHIAALELTMHVFATAIWPEGYNPVEIRQNSAQFKASLSAPPEFHFDKPLFASDTDWWYFNVFAHGLFGSEIYLSARAWGHGPSIAMAYTLFATIAWEYLVESWYKRPSAIDLVWTPMAGLIFGELRFRALRATKRRISNRAVRQFLSVLLDPLGELERMLVTCDMR